MSAPFGAEGLSGSESSGTLDSGSTTSAEQQVTDAPSDQGVSADDSQAQHESQATADGVEGSSIKFNPKWNGLLSKLPNEFHNIVAEDLKEWDRNYGQLSQSYAPWKQFSQQGVTPETLQSAYQLYQVMQTNPVEIYRRLGEALKDQLPQQQDQQQQETTEAEEYSENGNSQYDITTNPQYQQLQQQVEQMQQMFMQQHQSQLEDQYSQQIENALNQIEQKNGKFDRTDVLQRVASQIQRGEQPDIIKAYQDQQAFIQNILAQQGVSKATAPTVMPTNGGIPPATSNVQLDTAQGRADKFAELLRIAGS